MGSLLLTGLLIADNGCQGEQINAITGQQHIDSRIDKDAIVLEVYTAYFLVVAEKQVQKTYRQTHTGQPQYVSGLRLLRHN